MSKIDGFERRLERLRSGEVWIPFWLSQIGSPEEIIEYCRIRRGELAALHRQPHAASVPLRMAQVDDSQKESRAFERRLRAKYGDRMGQTLSEQYAEDEQNLEIKREVEQSRKDAAVLEGRER